METEKWRKCASVTTGGKPYFWFKNGATRQWIIWNRNLAQWELQRETINGATWVAYTAPTYQALLRID